MKTVFNRKYWNRRMKEEKLHKSFTDKNVIAFITCFPHISAMDLEEIMEWQGDNKYLSKKGIIFKNRFWNLFIKKEN